MKIIKYKNEIKMILMNEGKMNLTELVRKLDVKLKKDCIDLDREIYSEALKSLVSEGFIKEINNNLWKFTPRKI